MSLDTLSRIHNQKCPFTSRNRPRNLVRKIHVSRSINQVQDIFLTLVSIFHLNRVTLNRNPTFAFQVHIVQQLSLFFTSRNRLCRTKKPIGKRTFPVINMGNNAKISNFLHLKMFYFVQETMQFLRSFLYLSTIWAFPKGRAVRCNLFPLKERGKRISTSIPNATLFVTQLIYIKNPLRYINPQR